MKNMNEPTIHVRCVICDYKFSVSGEAAKKVPVCTQCWGPVVVESAVVAKPHVGDGFGFGLWNDI